jgi:hypothetical protein
MVRRRLEQKAEFVLYPNGLKPPTYSPIDYGIWKLSPSENIEAAWHLLPTKVKEKFNESIMEFQKGIENIPTKCRMYLSKSRWRKCLETPEHIRRARAHGVPQR